MPIKVTDFTSIKLKLASPQEILSWSYGEVLKPETINYRTQRPEPEGLFSERIFGPTRDWECYCGKYKRIRYKGIICDKCGVEVTRSMVRRERMGHIRLAVPVTHIWFLRGVPSATGLILDKSVQELEKVVYFASYIITEVNEKSRQDTLKEAEKEYKIKVGELTKKAAANSEIASLKEAYEQTRSELKSLRTTQVISEMEYINFSRKYSSVFKARIGAEAIRELLEKIDLVKLQQDLNKQLEKATSTNRKKILKRLHLIGGMLKAKIRPEWMCLTVLPVIPPDLRPMVQLDGGRFATSDLNDLYRRVINRNNRLKHLLELSAPEVICRNEKRMLQEAVDALIDNSIRRSQTTTASTGQRRQLRSLADMLKGKQGRFRQNLLGKRVDYSGRSVIVVGPELKLAQCGLPKEMALELFKPFITRKLIEQGAAYNVRSAAKLIEQKTDEVWSKLEEVIEGKLVLLNRAPTLHRLSIQAFYPVLIEGKAIQVHPLVCKAFNADFDGDQMAVHLPLTDEAQKEAREVMLSEKNLLKPATGEPIVIPSQDIVLGCYYMTKVKKNLAGEGKIFANIDEAIMAYQLRLVNLKAAIKLRLGTKNIIDTSVGRIIFNQILPKGLGFVNKTMDAKNLKEIVAEVFVKYGREETAKFVDRIKDLGFRYVTKSGLSWGMDDLKTPEIKSKIISQAEKKVKEISGQYQEGLLTESERRTRVIEIWTAVKNELTEKVKKYLDQHNSVYQMVDSGARSSWAVVSQMMGMKGLVVSPGGEPIELPIKNSFKEGFNVLEYFISTHGSRKGMTDIALRTSTAGYLTRRLIDVAQDIVVRAQDCGMRQGRIILREDEEELGRSFAERIFGRTALENIRDPRTGKILVKKGEQISKQTAQIIQASTISQVKVRSVIYCQVLRGVCQQCYGYDLGRNKLVELGEAVGIVTAQAIGEPGTQLTMRTFHAGGVAGRDITQGLPRVEEIFEARSPKGKALISEVDGVVEEITAANNQSIIKIRLSSDSSQEKVGWQDEKNSSSKDRKSQEKVSTKEPSEYKEYSIAQPIALTVEKGDFVTKGQQLTEGHLDIHELFALRGVEGVVEYILREVQQIYASQGEGINDKHIEIIIRQMLSRVRVKDVGTTDLLPGDIVEKAQFEEANRRALEQKGEPAVCEPLLLGITKASLSTESFLSAASFQETARVLISASLIGKEDKLRGLKENVIIGKLIPAGTGYKPM